MDVVFVAFFCFSEKRDVGGAKIPNPSEAVGELGWQHAVDAYIVYESGVSATRDSLESTPNFAQIVTTKV